MLTIYKTTEQGLEQIDSMANGAWVKVIDPSPEEIEKLVNWGIDVDYINYSLDFDEMPRMERDEDYTFILIRIPHSQPESDIPYITIPLGIMIKSNFIVQSAAMIRTCSRCWRTGYSSRRSHTAAFRTLGKTK